MGYNEVYGYLCVARRKGRREILEWGIRENRDKCNGMYLRERKEEWVNESKSRSTLDAKRVKLHIRAWAKGYKMKAMLVKIESAPKQVQ